MKKNLLALGLALALTLGLTACGPKEAPETETTPPAAETTPAAVESQAPESELGTDINLGLLNGPTGMGAAKLLSDNEAGETVNHYTVTLGSDPANDILPKLNNGELDIAALPTNVAANLYNKTGKVQLLALNTLGVLHILENGDTVNSLADLSGKTLYAGRPERQDPLRHQPGHQHRVCAGLLADPERPGPRHRCGYPVENQRGGHLSHGLRRN